MKEFHQWVSDMANSIEDKSTVTNKKKNSTELKEESKSETPTKEWTFTVRDGKLCDYLDEDY